MGCGGVSAIRRVAAASLKGSIVKRNKKNKRHPPSTAHLSLLVERGRELIYQEYPTM